MSEVQHKTEDKEKQLKQNEAEVDASSANVWIKWGSFSNTGAVKLKIDEGINKDSFEIAASCGADQLFR